MNRSARFVIGLIVFGILLGLAAPLHLAADEPLRTWTDRSGKFQTRAALVDVRDGQVRLQREDGAELRVPLDRLSDRDRAYLDQRLKAQQNAAQAMLPIWAGRFAGTTGVVVAASKETAVAVVQNDTYRGLLRGSQVHAVAASGGSLVGQVVATLPEVAALAIQLPADRFPVTVATSERIEAEQAVTLRGFEFDMSVTPPAFAAVEGRGTVSKIFRNPDGKISRFHVQADQPFAQSVAVFNQSGELLGMTAGPRTRRGDDRPPAQDEMQVTPWSRLARVLDPQLAQMSLSAKAISGDLLQLRFEIGVADPLNRGQEMKLRVAPRGAGNQAAMDADGRLANARELPVEFDPESSQWVAQLQTPPPAPLTTIFDAQLAYRVEDTAHVSPPVPLTLPGAGAAGGSNPQAIRYEDGGYLFTSSATAVAPDVLADLPQLSPEDYPEPVEDRRLIVGPGYRMGDVPAVAIQVPTDSLVDTIVFSDDGKWFYCVSKRGLVRKIALDTYEQHRTLNLDAPASGLALCEHGLAVATSDPLQVVLLDGDSLEVKGHTPLPLRQTAGPPGQAFPRSLPAPPVQLASAPSSPLVVALGHGSLWVVEAQSDEGPPRTIHHVSGVRSRWIAMAAHGRHVFTADNAVTRYRVDGRHLVLEEVGPTVAASNAQALCVSRDGTKVAIPAGGGNRAAEFPSVNYGTYVLDGHELDQLVVALETGAYPRTLAFDPVTNAIYAQNSENLLLILDADGNVVKQVRQRSHHEPRFFVPPQGRRLLVLNGPQFLALDLRTDAEPLQIAMEPPATALQSEPLEPRDDGPPIESVNETLKLAKLDVPNLEAWKLPRLDRDGKSHAAWSRDGKFFYLVTGKGTLRQVDAATHRVTRRVELGSECSGIAVSGVGLVVALKDRQSLWVLDYESLQLLQSTSVPSPHRLAAARDAALAIVSSSPKINVNISVVDLTRGKILSQFSPRELQQRVQQLTPGKSFPTLVDMREFTVSPDGRWLYTLDAFSAMKMRIGPDGTPIPDTTINVRADNPGRMSLSDDGKWFGTPGGGGNSLGDSKRRFSTPYTTLVFSTENPLEEPIAIQSGAYPRAIGIAPQVDRIYAQNHDIELLVYSMEGQELAQYDLADERGAMITSMRPDPSGMRLLIESDDALWLVHLPEDKLPRTGADQRAD